MRDAGVSEAIGTILMIALVVVLAGVVYVWVGYGSDAPAPPPAVGMNPESGTATDRSFILAEASSGLRWSQVAVHLDGADVPYDGTQTLTPSYCVVTTGSSCVTTGSWDPQTLMGGGQRLKLHATFLSCNTLQVVSPDSNAVLLQIALS